MLQTALVPDALSMHVPYLSSEQREQYRLSVSDRILRDASGLNPASHLHLVFRLCFMNSFFRQGEVEDDALIDSRLRTDAAAMPLNDPLYDCQFPNG
jgi:hypothetical protein